MVMTATLSDAVFDVAPTAQSYALVSSARKKPVVKLKPMMTMTISSAKNQSVVQNPVFFIFSPCRWRDEN